MAVPMIEAIINEGPKSLMESNSGIFMLHRFMEMTQSSGHIEQLSNSIFVALE